MTSPLLPLALPLTSHQYTAFYCEENAWWLAQTVGARAARSLVVFIANPARACALWRQRAGAPQNDGLVVWDYHVVLWAEDVHPDLHGPHIWDLDSTQGCPLPALSWTRATFPHGASVRPSLLPMFRRIDAAAFVRDLRSDRRHMRAPDGSWLQPPPPWPAPCDPLTPSSNLFDYATINAAGSSAAGPGEVLDWSGWLTAIATATTT